MRKKKSLALFLIPLLILLFLFLFLYAKLKKPLEILDLQASYIDKSHRKIGFYIDCRNISHKKTVDSFILSVICNSDEQAVFQLRILEPEGILPEKNYVFHEDFYEYNLPIKDIDTLEVSVSQVNFTDGSIWENLNKNDRIVAILGEKETTVSEITKSAEKVPAETTTTTTMGTTTAGSKPEENIFINFKCSEVSGENDIGGLADKAIEFLKTTDEYKESMDSINEFIGGKFDDYISNGEIIPKVIGAYPDDYDGDGKTETFIILELPCIYNYLYEDTKNYFVFADSSGNMIMLDTIPKSSPVSLLNYGNIKQVIFGGFSPYANAEEHYSIYGVKNGQAELLYISQRDYMRDNCFLLAPDRLLTSAMIYYNLEKGKYIIVSGKEISVSEIKKMDTAGNIKYEYDKCYLVGNKFYVMYDSTGFVSGTYIYENKEFVMSSWLRTNWDNEDSEEIDYDEAVSNMINLSF